jgi:hypothetical protein
MIVLVESGRKLPEIPSMLKLFIPVIYGGGILRTMPGAGYYFAITL